MRCPKRHFMKLATAAIAVFATITIPLHAQNDDFCDGPRATASVESEKPPYTYFSVATDIRPSEKAKKDYQWTLKPKGARVEIVGTIVVQGRVYEGGPMDRSEIPFDFSINAKWGSFSTSHKELLQGPEHDRKILAVHVTSVSCPEIKLFWCESGEQ
jgi:hypothetical protein